MNFLLTTLSIAFDGGRTLVPQCGVLQELGDFSDRFMSRVCDKDVCIAHEQSFKFVNISLAVTIVIIQSLLTSMCVKPFSQNNR
jgi:hypothetical protein